MGSRQVQQDSASTLSLQPDTRRAAVAYSLIWHGVQSSARSRLSTLAEALARAGACFAQRVSDLRCRHRIVG